MVVNSYRGWIDKYYHISIRKNNASTRNPDLRYSTPVTRCVTEQSYSNQESVVKDQFCTPRPQLLRLNVPLIANHTTPSLIIFTFHLYSAVAPPLPALLPEKGKTDIQLFEDVFWKRAPNYFW